MLEIEISVHINDKSYGFRMSMRHGERCDNLSLVCDDQCTHTDLYQYFHYENMKVTYHNNQKIIALSILLN